MADFKIAMNHIWLWFWCDEHDAQWCIKHRVWHLPSVDRY